MKPLFPPKLKRGDKIVVIAPSDSMSFLSPEVKAIADARFADTGLEVSLSKHANEVNEFDSSSIESRIRDLHDAFSDPSVKGIIAAFGGLNSNQLLRYIFRPALFNLRPKASF